ncbi:MAG: MFS transporter [Bauldia sp.]|uniref:MFS transporter n=1 Tax=Bauldia sp. TaxID=2575872 RepID=UPI001DAF40DE|nr:MFS transporter [Bauldia sp.]MCB1496175.1 MFS transporter [Bauldia sp.]
MRETRQGRQPTPASGDVPSAPPGVTAAGIVGNVLEWYDFALYGYLATVFAGQFFPSSDAVASLIGAYSAFAVGFLARPLGGVIYGRIGDRLGRRRLLTVSVAMMGLPTFALGLLPTYESVGLLAPVLLVALRFAQGISAGGEFSGSIVFLVEHAPPKRRGFQGSLSNFGAMIGGLAGAGVAWLLTAALSSEVLDAWGWRIPFLFGIVVTAIGLWLRMGVAESPAFSDIRNTGSVEKAPVVAAIRQHPREIAVTAGLNWVPSAGYYIVFVWLATDLSTVVGMSEATALGLSTLGVLVGTLAVPLFGAAADRFGPRLVLLIAGVATLVAAAPLLLLAGTGALVFAAIAQVGLAVMMAAYLGTLPGVFVSLHGPRVRCSSLSIGYNIAVAVFGGTAPLIATALVGATGWQVAPGLYLAATALIGLALLRFVPWRLDAPGAGKPD